MYFFALFIVLIHLLEADSAPPPLKSKTKHLAASSSSVTTAELPALGPVQDNLPPVCPGPSPVVPATPTPEQLELPSADINAPQAADVKAHAVRKDAAESEVSNLHRDMFDHIPTRKDSV